MKKIIVALGLLVLNLPLIPVYAQSTLRLQETCAERAKSFVERLDAPTTYNSHYSKKLDGCFVLCVLGSTLVK